MPTFMRMPNRLAFDLIAYCVSRTPPNRSSEELVRAVISVVLELPIVDVQLHADGAGRNDRAQIVLAATDATTFAELMPAARPLPFPSRTLAAFELTPHVHQGGE